MEHAARASVWNIPLCQRVLATLPLVVFVFLAAGEAAATRLCLQPLALPFAKDDERFGLVEDKVSAVFESAGFEITRPAEVLEAYEPVDEEWGAIYDANTGHTIEDKKTWFEHEVERAFREDLGCEGRLRVSLGIVRAPCTGPFATWDGTTRQVVSTGRTILVALTGEARCGWVAALSLWVQLMDSAGKEIGFRSAGIEPLVEFSVSRDLDKLPEDRWLRDEVALDGAIQSALGPRAELLRTRGTSRGPIDLRGFAWPGAGEGTTEP